MQTQSRKPKTNRKTRRAPNSAKKSTKRQLNIMQITTPKATAGNLVIIGGREDKEGDMSILSEVAAKAQGGALAIATVASELPKELWEDYQKVFRGLGIKDLRHLHLERSDDARAAEQLALLEGVNTIFFTGGDQLRITTRIGGTAVADRIFEIYHNGGTIAGTSAGASVMGETMLVGGEGQESHKVGNWMMAPGLGLVANMIIDQHFAQRGRIGRLLGAVALNPGVLGVGIDENTAIVIEGTTTRVVGQNAVYVVDGHDVSYTNISEAAAEKTMSMHNVRLHILAEGDRFDLESRRPSS